VEDLIEDGDVGHFLNVEADVSMIGRDSLELTSLQSASIPHVGSPNNVEFSCFLKMVQKYYTFFNGPYTYPHKFRF